MATTNDEFLSRNQPPLNQRDTKTRFSKSSVVITGGGSGIGRATVERFLNDGAEHVAVIDVNDANIEETKQDLSEEFSGILQFYKADVSDAGQVKSAVDDFASRCGGQIHHVVSSAVYFGTKGIDGTDDDFLTSFKVNVLGTVHLVQACRPFMKAGSSVVLVSSISAHRCQRQRWTYGATKGAIDILTKDMALDLGSAGIRINSVSPGWIWTPQQRKASSDGTRKAMADVVSRCSFLRRDGETSEVAAAVAFLSSKDASFIDGADLPVDGGYLAMGPEGLGERSVYAGHDE